MPGIQVMDHDGKVLYYAGTLHGAYSSIAHILGGGLTHADIELGKHFDIELEPAWQTTGRIIFKLHKPKSKSKDKGE